MNGKRFSQDKARRNGFYLALAVCLVAVGIAAWSTYDAVQSYTDAGDSQNSSLQQLQNSEVRQGQSEAEDQDPEKPRVTAAPTSSPRQTAGTAGKGAAPSPTAKPETSAASSPSSPAVSEENGEEAQVPVTAPLYERSSEMIHPLSSKEVAKAYSAGAPVYSETMKDWRIHTGMDETAQAGEEVRACANGQVQQTYSDRMLGNVVVIEHGDYVFSYCGVGEDFLVKEGDVVTKGQVIGTVTAVPCEAADGPHLHLEVRRDGVWMDPISVLAEVQ